MEIVWNTLAIDIELVPILKHPTSLLSSCPPTSLPFHSWISLSPTGWDEGGGGQEKTRVNLAGISHHVASSLQAQNSAA